MSACSRSPAPTSAHVQSEAHRAGVSVRGTDLLIQQVSVKIQVLTGITGAHQWTPGVHGLHSEDSWIKSFAQGCSSSEL